MEQRSLRVSAVAAPVREQVLHNLRGAILDRTFRPGQRLIERELCELTGVSRTSVREALRQLEAEGLVVLVPNRGPIVARISVKEATDLYQARGALEALAARLFTERATDEQLERLRRVVDELDAGASDADTGDLLDYKERFYAVLLEGAGNDAIAALLSSLRARVRYLRATSLHSAGRPPQTSSELRAITDAMARRDPDAAATLTLLHIDRAAEVALAILNDLNHEHEQSE